MAKLSVNVDHIATLREARKIEEPDPVTGAAIAELAGADGIIVHLREDRRHIQDRDVVLLKKTVKTKLNLEIAATEEMIRIALEVNPFMVTLVPEKREELTTEGGLDVHRLGQKLKKDLRLLQGGGILTSVFIDPDLDQVKAAHRLSTDIVEIHTGRYSDASDREDEDRQFEKIQDAVKMAAKLRLGIHAGHGLNYRNVSRVSQLKEIEEFSIGHSIIARAVLVGMDQAVREMLRLIKGR